MAIPNLGIKFTSGQTTRGHIILFREDDTWDNTPVWMFAGISYVDNGDGTATFTFA